MKAVGQALADLAKRLPTAAPQGWLQTGLPWDRMCNGVR